MAIFRFFDTDETGKADYDIADEQYQELLQTCFRYSATVSVILSPQFSGDIQAWEPYRIPVPPNVQRVYAHYGQAAGDWIQEFEIRHYRLDQRMQNLLLTYTKSMFQWLCGWGYDHPNDPAFFRSDGSVFFYSVIHEGHCTLQPRRDEDASGVISQARWIAI